MLILSRATLISMLAVMPAAILATVMASAAPKSRAPAAVLPTEKPYPVVAVTPAQAYGDPAFDTFRQELAVMAKGRIYTELERLVMAQSFFWDRDFTSNFERKQPAVDNLAAAVGLERRDGAGWAALARFAADPTAMSFPGRPGVICAPAPPHYDEVDFVRLLDLTQSDALDWAATRTDKTLVRSQPRNNAATIETLGIILVRKFDKAPKDNDNDRESARKIWPRIATPSGKVGYVEPDALLNLKTERLCYGKDGFGRWRIAGFVGGSD